MAETVGDDLVARLQEWGIARVYGYPGDGINGILGSLRKSGDRPRFIQTRHEEMAAFMACAHAKFTGEVGVCLATSGPGAIHLLNGLYDAKLDHQPVVAIMGQTFASVMGGDQQQEVDLLSLFKDVASAYVQQVNVPSALHHCIDRALRIAAAERTVTAVIIPADVQDMKAARQPQSIKSVHTGVGFVRDRGLPLDADLHRAADVLNAGAKVAMLVGAGALDATDEVLAVADTLGAGIAKALLGKAAVPDDIPYCTNSIGLLGTKPSWEMMQHADTLLVVGSSFPYANFLPPIGRARGVQIDRSARMLSLRYPMEVNLLGDSRATLRELLPLLRRNPDRSFQETIVKDVADWWRLMDDRGQPEDREGNRIRPQALFSALSRHLPDHAIVSSDSGSAANWFARHVRIRRGMKASLSGNLATMVPGVPYAIAAKFAYPDRVAVGTIGDGAMQMGGMAELITAAKYYRTWSDPRMVVLVLNNEDLNQVTWEQRVMEGDARFDASQSIPYVAFHEFARLIGLGSARVDHASQIEDAMREAFAADRPFVIDAMTDPEEPPLPPHITLEQAEGLTKSFLADPSDGVPGLVNAMREKVDEFLPGR
ncbi:MAG TPA: thiamine pyrophosphate-requiring protein [Candidatus Dormibacteraeota bacterium]|nr:thiamine pyrophosphate-requiring protein [Candidatus Dormibacteraeota bacterium]